MKSLILKFHVLCASLRVSLHVQTDSLHDHPGHLKEKYTVYKYSVKELSPVRGLGGYTMSPKVF